MATEMVDIMQKTDNNTPIKLGIIIPCYNEEEGLIETTTQLTHLFDKMIENKEISVESFICYVDDGSQDKTWEIIEKIQDNNPHFKGLKLSRNFGHQNALIAGLMQFKNDADGLISLFSIILSNKWVSCVVVSVNPSSSL